MTTDITFEQFDANEASRETWDKYHVFRKIRAKQMRPDDPIMPDEVVETQMKHKDPFSEEKSFIALADGQIVGSFGGGVMKPNAPGYESNKQYLWVGGSTLPEYRRRGIGTWWARKVLEMMNEWDREILTVWGVEEEDGHAFMRWLGADEKTTFAENRLDFRKIDWDMIEKWIEEGLAKSPDSKLEMFEDRLPDEFLEEYAPILSDLLMTMPFDDLDHGDIVMTPETLREDQKRRDETETKVHTLIVRLPDGRLAGMTDVGWNPNRPTFINQRFTGVHPDARGRGLGKLLKAYMLDFLRKKYDGLEWVVTGNAHSNDPMLAINHALGYREFKGSSAYQIDREKLRARVGSDAGKLQEPASL